MHNQDSCKLVRRIAGTACLLAGAAWVWAGVWLCILGDFPSIKISDDTYLMVGAVSINGVPMPNWAFYFVPTGFFIVAASLGFAGWQVIGTRR